MIPISVQKQFANPDGLQDNFMNFLSENNLKFTTSKTLMSVSFYDQLNVGLVTQAQFYQGAATPARTNVGSSFDRPVSEHVAIYAIRIFEGLNANITQTVWTASNNAVATLQNATMSIVNNGVRVLRKYPLTDFLADLTTKDHGLVMLDEVMLWAGNTEMEVTVEFDNAPILNTNLRVELVGYGLQ